MHPPDFATAPLMTLDEAAAVMGFSRQYAWRLERDALAKLRRAVLCDPLLLEIVENRGWVEEALDDGA